MYKVNITKLEKYDVSTCTSNIRSGKINEAGTGNEEK